MFGRLSGLVCAAMQVCNAVAQAVYPFGGTGVRQ